MRPYPTACLLVLLPLTAYGQNPDAEPPDTGRLQLVLNEGGHTGQLHRVLFAPDGKSLVTSAADGTVRVWDAATGAERDVIRVPGLMWGAAFALSRDGKTLAVAASFGGPAKGYGAVYLLSFPEGQIQKIIKIGAGGPVWGLAFSADGKRLASSSLATVRVWDVGDGTQRTSFDATGRLGTIAFSPDGTRLVVAAESGCLIRKLATGETVPLGSKGAPGHASQGVAWSDDGKTVATCTPDGLQLWSPDGKPIAGPKVPAYAAAFSADSRRIVVLGENDKGRDARLFELATGKELSRIPKSQLKAPVGHWPAAVALSPDGARVAQLADSDAVRAIHVWDADGRHVWRNAVTNWLVKGEVQAGWSRDAGAISWRTVADPDAWKGGATAFDLTNLQLTPAPLPKPSGLFWKWGPVGLEPGKDASVKILKGGNPLSQPSGPKGDIVLTDDKLMTMAGPGRAVIVHKGGPGGFGLFDANTGKLIRQCAMGSGVLSVAPSFDGRYVLALSSNQILSVVDAKDGALLLFLYVSGREWVAWTPKEGYYAASPGGERLIGWRVNHGPGQLPSFYPAEQFRKQLYRPDVIKLVLTKGSVAEAVRAANADRAGSGAAVPKGDADVEKLLPPGVTLAVADDARGERVTVKVTAQQACPEQPVKSLRLLVDGRPLSDGRAAVSFPPGQEKTRHEVSWEVELPPGKHKLTVLARSKDDTPSVSNTVEPRPVPVAEKDRPSVYHVAVGVNAYDQPQLALKAARGDAERLAAGVAAAANGGTAYRAKPAAVLVDKAATRGAVLKAVDDVRRAGPRPNDLLVLSFAGHGVRDGSEFFLLTREADPSSSAALVKTAISGAELAKALSDFPCQVLLLLDACHAGAVGALRPGSDDAARALSDVDVRVAVMCAALGHESAIERDGAGLFTAAVVRALRHDPDVFYDRETGELNVYHLQAFVYQEVTKASDGKQTPYLKMPLAQPAFTLTKFSK